MVVSKLQCQEKENIWGEEEDGKGKKQRAGWHSLESKRRNSVIIKPSEYFLTKGKPKGKS